MNCEEFEAIGLGLTRQTSSDEAAGAQRAAAMQHANSCARCAALEESWHEARVGLESWREATRELESPSRVEMRLRQEFRTRHRTLKARGKLIFAAWTLATAALLVSFVSWWNWRVSQNGGTHDPNTATAERNPQTGMPATSNDAGDLGNQDALVADNEGDFTLLPGSLPQETQDAAILRVRLQRGTLGSLGLPVSEDNAADWVQVDLMVGEDGQPKAVRLPAQSSD